MAAGKGDSFQVLFILAMPFPSYCNERASVGSAIVVSMKSRRWTGGKRHTIATTIVLGMGASKFDYLESHAFRSPKTPTDIG